MPTHRQSLLAIMQRIRNNLVLLTVCAWIGVLITLFAMNLDIDLPAHVGVMVAVYWSCIVALVFSALLGVFQILCACLGPFGTSATYRRSVLPRLLLSAVLIMAGLGVCVASLAVDLPARFGYWLAAFWCVGGAMIGAGLLMPFRLAAVGAWIGLLVQLFLLSGA